LLFFVALIYVTSQDSAITYLGNIINTGQDVYYCSGLINRLSTALLKIKYNAEDNP
jgi:hypothetical protein